MSEQPYPDFDVYDTLPKLVHYNAEHHGDDIAMREKELGLWQVYTWRDYDERVKRFALGFKALDVGEGDVIGLIGDSRPDWVAAAVASHAVRAVSLGIYQDSLDPEVEYLINYASARVIVAEDEEQVDKILNLGDTIPSVEKIVYCDARGMRKYDDDRLYFVEDLWAKGAVLETERPGLYAELVAATKGDDCAILCTTSGTTAQPKLAMLTGAGMIKHALVYNDIIPMGPEDEYVSVLPMPWIGEQFYALFHPVVCRNKLNFVEEPETMMADMREIGPTFLLFAPRVWEQIAADVRARIHDASPLKRWIYERGMKIGLEAAEQGRTSKLGQFLLFRALKDRLGFSRLRYAATGGAALGPDNFKFFMAMGVPMLQIYGQTELNGVYIMHREGDVDFDTVGKPFGHGYEVRIANPDKNGVGEIMSRHPHMFIGYYKNEQETRENLVDGWMHTGDAGYFDDKGHVVVIDRVKDIAATAGGDRFSPMFIENKLKFSPYIAEAVILGSEQPYLTAIICIRFAVLSKWAEQRRIGFTTYSDLAAREEIYELIRGEVAHVNATMPAPQQIRKFVLLYKELDADDGELTRTRKVRRGIIGDRYGNIIEALYSGVEYVDIDTVITFQDGTRQRIKTALKVVKMEAPAPVQQAAE
jgi:long-chain acyl-CoA synthetase